MGSGKHKRTNQIEENGGGEEGQERGEKEVEGR